MKNRPLTTANTKWLFRFICAAATFGVMACQDRSPKKVSAGSSVACPGGGSRLQGQCPSPSPVAKADSPTGSTSSDFDTQGDGSTGGVGDTTGDFGSKQSDKDFGSSTDPNFNTSMGEGGIYEPMYNNFNNNSGIFGNSNGISNGISGGMFGGINNGFYDNSFDNSMIDQNFNNNMNTGYQDPYFDSQNNFQQNFGSNNPSGSFGALAPTSAMQGYPYVKVIWAVVNQRLTVSAAFSHVEISDLRVTYDKDAFDVLGNWNPSTSAFEGNIEIPLTITFSYVGQMGPRKCTLKSRAKNVESAPSQPICI